MTMKRCSLLVVNLALLSVAISNPTPPEIVEIGEEKDIWDINKGSMVDDMLQSKLAASAIVSGKLWTSPVPYALEESLEINAKGVILNAMEQFRLKTCIDFKPRDAEAYYLSIQKLSGCYSYVGQVIPDGQTLSIGKYCDELSTVEHEILHALGFYHEQSRYDRDDYVTIVEENIVEGYVYNFRKIDSSESTTQGVEYDYTSVMHYGENAFSNGNGSTIITKDPAFQDVIGQRLDMSPNDVLELNLLYSCNSTISFQMSCSFTDESICHMTKCSRSELEWEMVTSVSGGPTSDHTNLPSGNDESGEGEGYFMHVSTASGQEGDSAWLETNRMSPKRDCHVQCLQFYYYHSGNEGDQLNIWVREFEDEMDTKGTARLMGQVTGSPTSHWRFHHVSLNATKHFQVEFEVRKGTGSSTGGLSIDDINLSDTECPHVTLQIDDLENRLATEPWGTYIYSPRQYSPAGYAYRTAVVLRKYYVGLLVQLISGDNDDMLDWPCPYRQITLRMLDQNPNIQLQMSKQRSFTSDPTAVGTNGLYLWDNPRKNGTIFIDENNEEAYAGPLLGRSYFIGTEDMKFREFLKGGSAVFSFSFQNIHPLMANHKLPCPAVGAATITHPHHGHDDGPCEARMRTTTLRPTTTKMTHTSSTPVGPTDDKSIFGFSPAMVASPALISLLAVMLLLH